MATVVARSDRTARSAWHHARRGAHDGRLPPRPPASCTRTRTTCRSSSTKATSSWSTRRARSPPRSTRSARTARRSSCTCRNGSRPVMWLVELRRPDGGATQPWFDEPPGRTLRLVGGGVVRLATRFESSQRLWVATLDLAVPVLTYLAVHGRPIRYGYVTRDWPLDVYQNVYAASPAAPRCRARAVRSRPSSSRGSWRRVSVSRRSCCTPACRRSKRTSTRIPSGTASRR